MTPQLIGVGLCFLAGVTTYMVCWIEEKKDRARERDIVRKRMRKLGML